MWSPRNSASLPSKAPSAYPGTGTCRTAADAPGSSLYLRGGVARCKRSCPRNSSPARATCGRSACRWAVCVWPPDHADTAPAGHDDECVSNPRFSWVTELRADRPVGFGGAPFALLGTPAAETDVLLGPPLDLGVGLLDTAACYGGGSSEEAIGRAIGARRGEYTLVSKCGIGGGDPGQLGLVVVAELGRARPAAAILTCTP